MAKSKERKALKKGKAAFTLIGKAKVTDKTFNLDNSYDSGWTDNQMYLGVDCGNGNMVYGEMRGGFFPDDDNILRGFSKDDKDDDGKSVQVEVAWEDRFNEELLDTIADTSFITVGVEKDVKGKTVYKKFLSAYDAVEYLNEHLEDGMIVNVKGNIGYSEYEDNVTVKKEITSIVLSKVEDEADFKATFTQTILIGFDSIGKKNPEKNTIALNAYVVDYVGKPKIDGKKVDIKKNITYPKTFEVAINDNPEITAKMLQKFFKVKKKGTINVLTVMGDLIEGAAIVNITEDDIPDDIKELIEMGLYSEEEAKAKCAVGGNNRERRMVIIKPDITYVGQDDERKPTVAFEEAKYDDTDLYFYEQALNDAGVEVDNTDDSGSGSDDVSEEDDLLAMLDNM
ncbi:MAG: hypothetical protein HDQ99_03030 [Lachnospiraceae bacterium]|nr:hypothetical protein [Lachnospiraceae bacterium]